MLDDDIIILLIKEPGVDVSSGLLQEGQVLFVIKFEHLVQTR